MAQAEQLAIDFGHDKALVCSHRHHVKAVDRVWCDLHNVWTACGMPLCGELAGCAYDEPDNGKEACARRLEWLKANR